MNAPLLNDICLRPLLTAPTSVLTPRRWGHTSGAIFRASACCTPGDGPFWWFNFGGFPLSILVETL